MLKIRLYAKGRSRGRVKRVVVSRHVHTNPALKVLGHTTRLPATHPRLNHINCNCSPAPFHRTETARKAKVARNHHEHRSSGL